MKWLLIITFVQRRDVQYSFEIYRCLPWKPTTLYQKLRITLESKRIHSLYCGKSRVRMHEDEGQGKIELRVTELQLETKRSSSFTYLTRVRPLYIATDLCHLSVGVSNLKTQSANGYFYSSVYADRVFRVTYQYVPRICNVYLKSQDVSLRL